MPVYEHYHDTVHWHMADITSRIIAESGIPSDRFHLGKIILQSLKDSPDVLAQIEGSSGESETNSSLLRRTIKCALALKKMGLQVGDVMILMAPNHLDLAVPFYAAIYLGIKVAPMDVLFGTRKIMESFALTKPNVIFCQNEKVGDIRKALDLLEMQKRVITFDKGDGDMTFAELMEGDYTEKLEEFRATDFDPAETISMILPTTGSTGLPKLVAITHKHLAVVAPYQWARTVEIPPCKVLLHIGKMIFISSVRYYVCAPLLKFTRLQTVQDATPEHIHELINKYRPSFLKTSPAMIMNLMKSENAAKCDFTCFETILLGAVHVDPYVINEVKKIAPNTEVRNIYGMTELAGQPFQHGMSSPPHSCGKPIPYFQYRLVDVAKGTDINEPNVKGELWLKGPTLFKGYYNNPEATNKIYDGMWFKTGDIFYRDASWNFFFVDRINFIISYNEFRISPVEVEGVIRQLPGVLEVAVTSIPKLECEQLPIVCVVPAPDNPPTAQEIKDLVIESLPEVKQLQVGVIFLEEIPVLAHQKINRRKVNEIARTMEIRVQ